MQKDDYSPLTVPAYTPTEASRYLEIPVSTVRSWTKGYRYKTKSGSRYFKPVIQTPDPLYLSFQNLIEVFVLNEIRKKYSVLLPLIRKAIDKLKRRFGTEHPLADIELLTDKTDLFVEAFGEYLNVTHENQIEMKQIIEACILRIERDEHQQISRFYPISADLEYTSKPIEINPRIQFGRPCVTGEGIPTEVLYGRFLSGDDINFLAYDYDCSSDKIRAAIEYEQRIHGKAA